MDNEPDIVTLLRRSEWYCNKSEEHMGYCNKKCAKRNLPNPDDCHAAADEIDRLRGELVSTANRLTEERDEARREVCWIMQKTGFMRGDYANSRGWDCFKDREGPCPASVSTFWDVIENDTQMWINKVDQQRKVLDWVLPQLFQEVYPEYDFGHPRMYTYSTVLKRPEGGFSKEMYDTIRNVLEAKP